MVLIDHQLLWIPRKAALRNTPFQDVVICGKAADAEQGKACKNEQRHLLWFSFGRFTAAQAAPEGQEFKPPRLLCISCDPAGAMSHSTGPTTSLTLNPIVSSRFMRNLDLGVSHMTYLIHSGTEVGN